MKWLLAAFWVALAVIFFALRFDASERTYFQIDDQVVVWLVDDAVNKNNWQPDWYRAGEENKKTTDKDYAAARAANHDLPHDHHYNFSAHILLSAAIIKPLRLLGLDTPTIALLHHIALMWDTLSLLLLIATARRLGGQRLDGQALALCSAMIYTVFPLAVQGSHYARPDALLTAMGSAVLWLALQKTTLQHWRWLLANGVFIGVAVGGKASQLMLGMYPALASSVVLLNPQNRKSKTFLSITLDGVVLLSVIAAVLALMFFIGNITAQDFWLSVQSIQLYYQHPNPPDTLEHYSFGAQLFKILHYFYATLGWPLVLAIIAGAIFLTRKADKLPLLLLTVPPVFFILYFASLPAFFDRSFCALAAGIVLLAAIGITNTINSILSLPAKCFFIVATTALACWKPVVIQYHLQTDHLRSHHNDNRLAFQQQLKQDWSQKTGVEYWLKNISALDLFSQTLPEKPPKNPRIYVAEDMNDWNSRDYLQKLRNNGFVQIAEFEGDFADMPTNSLITVHEAARFVYFVRQDDMPAQEQH
ncbi:MAG TPA: glycosyltransferase family 39 protein [Pseudomonadales bacterium]|nr:glycosyltransferase family 39 protein [Pseudomonadales bacterium]